MPEKRLGPGVESWVKPRVKNLQSRGGVTRPVGGRRVYGTEGREFESLRARRKKTPLRRGFFISGSGRGRALQVLVQTEVRTSAGAIVVTRLVTLMVWIAVQR
jgi:hypothetical protein